MVNSRQIVSVLLLVSLFVFIASAKSSSSKCKISVVQKLSDRTSSNYYTYTGTITNVGSLPISNAVLTSSKNLHSVSGLSNADNNDYELPSSIGDIDVGASYSFTFAVHEGTNVQWSSAATCSAAAAATEAPVSKPTVAATSKHTTAAPTSKPTSKATAAPTTAKPSKTTTAPTTSKATSKATAASTASTSKATTASSSGKKCSSGSWWAPVPGTTYQWQLTGTIDQSINVEMYDIDLFDNSAATITSLHNAGRTVICYFSTQYENWRPDAASFTSAVLGNNLDDWAGEKYVDIRSTVVRNIATSRLDLAVSKGCDGVEPDNVDGYEAKTGFPLTAADQISFNSFIATEAHARGLSVGLKNDIDQAKTLEPYFDWALNEQCYEYDECTSLNAFVTAGKAVFNTEYSGSASKVCPYMVGLKFSSLIKTLDLTAAITAQCCTYTSGGCATMPAAKCVSSMASRDVEVAEDAIETESL